MAMQSIMLPDVLTLETVEAYTAELRSCAFMQGDTLTLDASATQSIGMVGVQLLLSLHRTVAALGATLVLTGARDVMQRAFQDLGCGQQWQQLTTAAS